MSYLQHTRSLLFLALPLIGSNLAQVAIGMTDTLMLGLYGADELAAATLGTSFFFTLFIFGSGFAWAVMPLVAEAAEKRDGVTMRRATRMGLWLSMLFCLAVMPAMWFSEAILIMIGQKADIARLAQDYLRIAGWGIIPGLAVMVLKSYLSALERTRVIFIVTLLAALLNIALNYVLIFGKFGAPEMGIRGAAVASLALTVFSQLVLMVYINRKFPGNGLFLRLWRPDWGAFASVFRLGWPIGLTNLAETGLFATSVVMMGWISKDSLAAHGIAIQMASATFVVHMGLSQAATVRAGRALGRQDRPGLLAGAKASYILSVLFSGITIAAFLAAPEFYVGLFLDADEPRRDTIIVIGAKLVIVAAIFQLADGIQVMALGVLRGIQDTKVPMIHAAISYWLVGLPGGYILAFETGLGPVGIWTGFVIGLSLAALLLTVRFMRLGRRVIPEEAQAASIPASDPAV